MMEIKSCQSCPLRDKDRCDALLYLEITDVRVELDDWNLDFGMWFKHDSLLVTNRYAMHLVHPRCPLSKITETDDGTES